MINLCKSDHTILPSSWKKSSTRQAVLLAGEATTYSRYRCIQDHVERKAFRANMEGFWPTDSGGCFFGDGDPGVLFWGSDEAGCFKASGIFYGMNREVPRIWRWRSIIALYGVASKSDGFWAKWEIHSHRPQKITLKVSKWQQLTSTNYVPKKNVSENLKKISFDFSLPLKSLHKCLFFRL